MASLSFVQIDNSNWYKPSPAPPAGALLFFIIGKPVKPSYTLDETWDPANKGYYLFFDNTPGSDYTLLTNSLQELLPAEPPSFSSFGWAKLDTANPSQIEEVKLSLLAPTAGSVYPHVTNTVSLYPIPGINAVVFEQESLVFPLTDISGNINGFSFTYPPLPAHDGQPAAQTPIGKGLTLPMGGPMAGGFVFEALLNLPSETGDVSWKKELYNVHQDPLRPDDPMRNQQTDTGITLLLTQHTDGSFSIS